MHVSDAFRPSTMYKYRRDWNPVSYGNGKRKEWDMEGRHTNTAWQGKERDGKVG